MRWEDDGTILSLRRHGETSAIVEIFTATRGRHAGLVRGGASRKMAPHLQPGTHVRAEWSARLDDHLGVFKVETLRSRSAALMGDATALAVFGAVSGLLRATLPEREDHPRLYRETEALFDALGAGDPGPAYALWELVLLEDMGFGLDLSECAVTGVTQDLAFVSPKSGRAVSRNGAGEWAARLLPLPPFMRAGIDSANPEDLAAGLRLTGHFLENRLMPELGRDRLPEARTRALSLLLR
ncbi:DNA repair protein RecO [Paracoccaceae bacterium GXU_MW_L88]